MKTELKDVLHLYLGCQVETNEGYGVLVKIGVTQDEGDSLIQLKHGDPTCIEWYKPILRPLSDMTIEEFQELGLYNEMNEDWLDTTVEKEFESHKKFDSIDNAIYPKDFPKYLKMGFDLFNLIGTKQAIDKTTLTP